MRFPSAKDIDAWIHFGRTNMRTAQNIVIHVDHWFSGYGAVGELDVAWFQVRGIPLDRNCPVIVYAGSTVGKTLAIDRHSLNNVDYIRILIGNLNVALVPPVVPNVNIGAGFCRCSGYRGIPVHLLLGSFNGLASAQGWNDDRSPAEKTLMRRRLMRRTTAKTTKDQKTSS
jgi:hypothetical protein